MKLYNRKQYEQALKCFQFSGDIEMDKKSKANALA